MGLILSDEQQAAVDSHAQYLCILACAGSGKTTTLTRRIARLVNEDKLDPSRIAAITFTVMAGERLKYELSRVLSDRSAASLMFVGTIHSFCLQLLLGEGALSTEAFEPITDSQQFILLNKNWSDWAIEKVAPALSKSAVIERLIASFDIIKMNTVGRHDLERNHPELARVFELYNSHLTSAGYFDFADMLVRVRALMHDDPNARQRIVQHYSHIFIDEYQDVDPVQAAIVDLFRDSAHICVVGDDDQAIYQFRGADERNIQDFARAPACETLPLSDNRRSPLNLLAIANCTITKVQSRLQKTVHTSVAHGLVRIKRFRALQGEIGYIVRTLSALKCAGAITSWGQVAILLRSMASYGSVYVTALKDAGIPYLSRGARTLFQTREIQQLAAIIEWFAKDTDAIEHLPLLAPLFGAVPPVDRLGRVAERSSLLTEAHWVAAGLAQSDWMLLTRLHALRTKYEERKFGCLLELVHAFIELLALMSPEASAPSKYNVARFTGIMAEYEKIQDNKSFRSLAAFLAAYARNSYDEVSPPEHQHDAVNVLTVHQSKGLEFDYVFVPMLVRGRFPLGRSSRRWLIDDSLFDSARYRNCLDNERRLFYVACTRARKALYLLSSADVGLAHPKRPSQFWLESRRVRLPDANARARRQQKAADTTRYLVIGYSSLEYYLTCPYRYQLVVEFGLEFPQAVYFQFGKLIHDAFAYLNGAAASGQPVSVSDACAYVQENFPRYYKNTNMRQYDIRKQQLRGIKVIEAYYSRRAHWMNAVVGVERDFAYVADRALVKGRYDVLVRNARGKHSIIDYKTGQPHAGLRTDFQMQFYSLAAATQLGIDLDEAIVYYVERDQPVTFPVTRQFLEQGQLQLEGTINGILARDFPARPRKGLCSQCEARRLCPYKA